MNRIKEELNHEQELFDDNIYWASHAITSIKSILSEEEDITASCYIVNEIIKHCENMKEEWNRAQLHKEKINLLKYLMEEDNGTV